MEKKELGTKNQEDAKGRRKERKKLNYKVRGRDSGDENGRQKGIRNC